MGEASVYRTFNYELLAGDPNLNVEVREADCVFRFDYSKVYYNSKLNTEHQRIVDLFQPGEAVCDVMAGVGPFAVPAGKKNVFVWANDLNPECFQSLEDAITQNKVCLPRTKSPVVWITHCNRSKNSCVRSTWMEENSSAAQHRSYSRRTIP